jgi:transcriptional regulator with XRE-family HTH domain
MKIERVNLGAIIKGLVEERGLNDAQFARMIGVQRQNVRKTIYDKQSLDTNLLCVISEVLDCNLFDYYKCNREDNKTELKATLTVEMGKEKKDKVFRFVFGENNVEIK